MRLGKKQKLSDLQNNLEFSDSNMASFQNWDLDKLLHEHEQLSVKWNEGDDLGGC